MTSKNVLPWLKSFPEREHDHPDAKLEIMAPHTVSSFTSSSPPSDASTIATLSLNCTRHLENPSRIPLGTRSTHRDQFGDQPDCLPRVVGHESLVDAW